MTNPKLKDVLSRVRRWPDKCQVDAARLLEALEAQNQCPLRLSDDQVAEIQRRLEMSVPRLRTIDEVRNRILG